MQNVATIYSRQITPVSVSVELFVWPPAPSGCCTDCAATGDAVKSSAAINVNFLIEWLPSRPSPAACAFVFGEDQQLSPQVEAIDFTIAHLRHPCASPSLPRKVAHFWHGSRFQAVNVCRSLVRLSTVSADGGEVATQFEFAQNVWANDPNFHELGNERDQMIGAQDVRSTLQFQSVLSARR